jgi:hypothetical protein
MGPEKFRPKKFLRLKSFHFCGGILALQERCPRRDKFSCSVGADESAISLFSASASVSVFSCRRGFITAPGPQGAAAWMALCGPHVGHGTPTYNCGTIGIIRGYLYRCRHRGFGVSKQRLDQPRTAGLEIGVACFGGSACGACKCWC